jgi:hypothetical protein
MQRARPDGKKIRWSEQEPDAQGEFSVWVFQAPGLEPSTGLRKAEKTVETAEDKWVDSLHKSSQDA